MAAIWDALVDCICRPPRDNYEDRNLLGGKQGMLNDNACRIDFVVKNKKGLKLECSQYMPLDIQTVDGRLPVVVYCHCNSGSKRDADEAVVHLLPAGISVVAFDFSGSGRSDGHWVTLGANEVEDLEAVITHLRAQGSVSSIGLWGRSMGAVTALMYSARDPTIAGMVLDSPFSRLTDLMLEIVQQQKLPIPKMMLKMVLRMMRNSVKKKAGFDINDVSPIDLVPSSVIPAVFGHGKQDTFINISHSEKLQAAYGGEYRNLVRFDGDHNHPRPQFFYDSVTIFFHQQLQLEKVLVGRRPFDRVLLQHASASLAEDDPRSQGITNQPWQVGDLPDLAQPNTAAAALEAAVEDGNPSNAGGAVPTRPSALAAVGEGGAAASASSTGGVEQTPAAAATNSGSSSKRGAGLLGGWRMDAAEQLRKVPLLGGRRSSPATGEQPVDVQQQQQQQRPGEQPSQQQEALQPQQEQERLQQAAARMAALEEQHLAAAIAASLEQIRLEEEARLQTQQQQPQEGRTAAAAAAPVTAGGAGPGAEELPARSRTVPADVLEEERMLQMALTLSLQESAAAAAPTPGTSNGGISKANMAAEPGSGHGASSSSSPVAAPAHFASGSGAPTDCEVPSSTQAVPTAMAEAAPMVTGRELAAAGTLGQAAAVDTAGGTSTSRTASPSSGGRSESYQGVKVSPLRGVSAASLPAPPASTPDAAAPTGPLPPGAPSASHPVHTVSSAHSPMPGVNAVSLRRSAGGAQV